MSRITIALDFGSSLDRILPAAVLLASAQDAELRFVVSENRELLRAADLPCVYETGIRSALSHAVNSTSLRTQQKKFAEDIRLQLVRRTAKLDLKWCFEETDEPLSELLANATNCAIISDQSLKASTAGRSGRRSRFDSFETPVIAVMDDQTPAASRLLSLARRMAVSGHRNYCIEVLHANEASADSLLPALRHCRPVVLLIGRTQSPADSSRAIRKLALFGCPFAIIPVIEN